MVWLWLWMVGVAEGPSGGGGGWWEVLLLACLPKCNRRPSAGCSSWRRCPHPAAVALRLPPTSPRSVQHRLTPVRGSPPTLPSRAAAGATGSSEEVRHLADEVLAHLRSLAGADALLAGYNAAREEVHDARTTRKRRAAQQALVDPEAAAKRRMRKQQRKTSGRRKRVEEVRRQRSAGVFVKNKGKRRRKE